MKCLFALIFILTVSMSSFAQKADDKKAVLNVIDRLFEKMAAHEPSEIVALFAAADSQLFAVIKQKNGKSVTRTFTGEVFSKNFAEKRGTLEELMYKPNVEVHGDLALISGRYVFFTDNKISHCGVNSFHLVRGENGWKIANAATTIEPDGCTAKEKKMKPKSVK